MPRPKKCPEELIQYQVEQLLASDVDLRARLATAEEELDAARRLNRALIRERTSGPTELGA